jgi:hypothetical protein
MSSSGPTQNDPATEFAKELAKQLPVKAIYEDAVSPAVKQTGQLVTDIVKVIQLALAPLQFLAAYQDRLRNFINKSVRRVPKEKRVSPAPQILGPIIEGIRYEPEGTPIDEMFSELLSRSMDRDRVNEAHPAYPILIKQLSSDEAKVLATLKGKQFDYVYTRDYDASTALFHGPAKIEVDDLPRSNLAYPDNVGFYFDHLSQLGLAGIYQEGNQEPLFDTPRTKQIGVRVRSKYTLTESGKRFVRACIPEG